MKKESIKDSLSNEIKQLEGEKRKKLEKYELVKQIIGGNEFVSQDLEIDQREIFDFVPNTPVEGFEDILKGLNDLKAVLSKDDNIKIKNEVETKHVNVKYSGQTVKYMYLHDPKYLFIDLLQDVCSFFNIEKYNDYTLKDDVNHAWPLNSSVTEYMKINRKVY